MQAAWRSAQGQAPQSGRTGGLAVAGPPNDGAGHVVRSRCSAPRGVGPRRRAARSTESLAVLVLLPLLGAGRAAASWGCRHRCQSAPFSTLSGPNTGRSMFACGAAIRGVEEGVYRRAPAPPPALPRRGNARWDDGEEFQSRERHQGHEERLSATLRTFSATTLPGLSAGKISTLSKCSMK